MSKYTYDGNKLLVENAEFMFRPEFTGEKHKYNPNGIRRFTIRIDDEELVEQLRDDGWTVKSKVYEDEVANFIEVVIRFDSSYALRHPPKAYIQTSRNRRELTEETLHELDEIEIKNVDITINAVPWEFNGNTGVKGYMKNMYVTMEEDEWAWKYADEEYPQDE